MPVAIEQKDMFELDEKKTNIFQQMVKQYEDKQSESDGTETDIDLSDEEWMIIGKAKYEKRTNIFDIGEKLPVNKPKMLGLQSFKQAKIVKKRFDNEPPSKESVAFQRQVMEEVVKGNQMRLFEMNPVFQKRPLKFIRKQEDEALKRLVR